MHENARVNRPIPLPAAAPAAVLAETRSPAEFPFPVSQACRMKLLLPQYVVPRPNHCMPEAVAKKTAGVSRMTPAMPPTSSPADPGMGC